jgi:uncharacterized membrane protein
MTDTKHQRHLDRTILDGRPQPADDRPWPGFGRLAAALAVLTLLGLPAPAFADLRLCNRMSYVIDVAIAIEEGGNAATRGWFRVEPGQCNAVVQGDLKADQLYVHVRALSLYGAAPAPAAGHADFCISDMNFLIPGAKRCRAGHKLTQFVEIKPSDSDKGPTAYLAEDAKDNYDDEQARLAGLQRLLTVAGYDATPIDGVPGKKTEAALAQFLKDRGLPANAPTAANFFNILIEAARVPTGPGFSWCNETPHAVMAALGVEEKGGIVTRGWYRVAAGTCVKPDLRGAVRKLYSFAEALDADGRPVQRGGKPLTWSGGTVLCTRESKFELSDHKDCAAGGLGSAGFVSVDLGGTKSSAVVRFRE